MKVSEAGLALIKEYEGCRLDAYPDPGTRGEPWTIGYGRAVGVHPSDRITQDEAEAFLRADLERFEQCVSAAVGQHVNEAEFSACVCLAFNIGCDAFSKSTLVRKIRSEDMWGAANEFLRWDRAAGKQMAGLTRRRKAERALFLS